VVQWCSGAVVQWCMGAWTAAHLLRVVGAAAGRAVLAHVPAAPVGDEVTLAQALAAVFAQRHLAVVALQVPLLRVDVVGHR
jgi:hypothetical protein